MKYYIEDDDVNLHYLGEFKNDVFISGHGLNIINEFPYLINEIKIIDGDGNYVSTGKFLNMVEGNLKIKRKESLERKIKHIEDTLKSSTGNRNYLDGWATKCMNDKLDELREELKLL